MSVASSAQTSVAAPARIAGTPVPLSLRMPDLLEMCRPRIAVMTLAAAATGFLLASPIAVHWSRLAAALAGILQLVAASSILNQVLEMSTDALMDRTADRPLIRGRVSRLEAVLAGVFLAVSGTTVLLAFSDPAATVAGVGTLFLYVLVYTPLKTRSSLCTTLGAVPGAMPPVLGWFAAGGSPGSSALALFALLFTWQFPHFLAIGWIHRHDYRRAGLRMLPSFSDGGRRAGLVAVVYAAAFVPVSMMPVYVGLTGRCYFVTGLLLSALYLAAAISFAFRRTSQAGRVLLLTSLFVLPALLLVMVSEFLYLRALS